VNVDEAKYFTDQTEILSITRESDQAFVACSNGETYTIWSDATRYVTVVK
jgi:hypothetical protein